MHYVNGHSVLSLCVKESKEIISSGHHLEISAVAVPRHIDIPAVVRILDEGQCVLSSAVGEDALYEVVDCAEVVDEICHGFYFFRFVVSHAAKLQNLKSEKQSKGSPMSLLYLILIKLYLFFHM